MVQVTLDFDDGVLTGIREDPLLFGNELRAAAAVKWYELGLICRGHAAKIAGVSHFEFLFVLSRYWSRTPLQEDSDYLAEVIELIKRDIREESIASG